MSSHNYRVEIQEITEQRELIDLSTERSENEDRPPPNEAAQVTPILKNKNENKINTTEATSPDEAKPAPMAAGSTASPVIEINDSDEEEPACSSSSSSTSPIQFLQRAPILKSTKKPTVPKKKKEKKAVSKTKKQAKHGKDRLDTLSFAASMRDVADRHRGRDVDNSCISFEYRTPIKRKVKKCRKKIDPEGYKLYANSRELAKRTAAGFCVCEYSMH